MEQTIPDSVIRQAFDLLLEGKTTGEIRTKFGFSSSQWNVVNRRFTQLGLINESGPKTKAQLLEEIEKELWECLELRPKLINTSRLDIRIDRLTKRYAEFLL